VPLGSGAVTSTHGRREAAARAGSTARHSTADAGYRDVAAVRGASDIFLECTFSPEGSARVHRDALRRAARRSRPCRHNAWGLRPGRAGRTSLAAAGCRSVWVGPRRARRTPPANHRKILVDGEVAFVGRLGVADGTECGSAPGGRRGRPRRGSRRPVAVWLDRARRGAVAARAVGARLAVGSAAAAACAPSSIRAARCGSRRHAYFLPDRHLVGRCARCGAGVSVRLVLAGHSTCDRDPPRAGSTGKLLAPASGSPGGSARCCTQAAAVDGGGSSSAANLDPFSLANLRRSPRSTCRTSRRRAVDRGAVRGERITLSTSARSRLERFAVETLGPVIARAAGIALDLAAPRRAARSGTSAPGLARAVASRRTRPSRSQARPGCPHRIATGRCDSAPLPLGGARQRPGGVRVPRAPSKVGPAREDLRPR
jgi:hypothetical protein